MVLFHVKPTEKSFLSWQKVGFSMVCVMLQAVYTTAEKEFRTIVFLIFDASCWHKKSSNTSQKMEQHDISSSSL